MAKQGTQSAQDTQAELNTNEWFSYLLQSTDKKRTYIGATNNVHRRLRQHNRELAGGAHATAGRSWDRLLYVTGFPTWNAALQFEWAWKHYSRKRGKGLEAKVRGLAFVLSLDKCTNNSVPYKCWKSGPRIVFDLRNKGVLEKIDAWSGLQVYVVPPTKPSTSNLPTMPSNAPTVASLSSKIETLEAELNALKARFDALAAAPAPAEAAPKKRGRKPKGGEAASDADAEKKPRKPRAKKEKPVCPEPAEGVIRFFSGAKDAANREFTNTYKAEITVDGETYATAEHYIICQKYSEAEYVAKIREQTNPALVRMMGKSAEHGAADDWETTRLDVTRKAMQAKFAAHEALKAQLLATGDAPIEYADAEDTFWGIGADGAGANQMGRILMDIRASLRA
jgi:ribA/ribD-fused uncharacterized protein